MKLNVKNINNIKEKINICYVRVSTQGQKSDLEHQKKYMIKKYPKYEIIEDIGSGINFNRKGLRRIIKLGIEEFERLSADAMQTRKYTRDELKEVINTYKLKIKLLKSEQI